MSIFFIEDKSGNYFSADGKRRFIKLSGQEAYRFLRSSRGKGRHFYKTTTEEEDGETLIRIKTVYRVLKRE